jgi:hypothetical protein
VATIFAVNIGNLMFVEQQPEQIAIKRLMKLTAEREIKEMMIHLKLVTLRIALQSQMIQNIVDISPQL